MNDQQQGAGEEINALVNELIRQASVKTALVVTKDGNLLAAGGNTDYLNLTGIAALIAGMFAATREVAHLVGEDQFSILLQQGEKRHIHISLVNDDVMLVAVFDDYRQIGLVRHRARSVGTKIGKQLARGDSRGVWAFREALTETDFRDGALSLIDQVFKDNGE